MGSIAGAPGFAISRHDGLPPEAALVDDGLDQANAAAAPLHEVQSFCCLARDADGQVLGGAVGRRWGPCAELQQLWVRPEQRRQGLGAALVRSFEAQAAAHGCHQLYLETFSFQAPRFYAALGWRSVHQLDAYPHGIVKHLMRRDLDIAESS